MDQNIGFWGLPFERAGVPAGADLIKRRAAVVSARSDSKIAFDEAYIAGVRCLRFPAPRADAPTLLYLHGGGYRMGAPEPWAAYADSLRDSTGCTIIVPDYRLAPEHPFPAALHDVAAVYAALTHDGSIIVGGDSAGGGLAASLAQAAYHAGARPLSGLILISPMLDLQASCDTYETRASSDQYFSRASILECAKMYLQGHPPEDPLVSPLNADPRAFPATLILVGGKEVILGEAVSFASKLALGGKSITLLVSEAVGHVWPMLEPDAAATREALRAISNFVLATSD